MVAGSSRQAKAQKSKLKSTDLVLPLIEQQVLDHVDDRRVDVVHPSEIVHGDWCPRATYYTIVHGVDKEQHSAQMHRIFDEGHAIHDKYQSRLWKAGVLFGKWQCVVCEKTWYAQSPSLCQFCGAPEWKLRYREVPVESDEHLIRGHADGIVDVSRTSGGTTNLVLLEIKSVSLGSVRVLDPALYKRFDSGELDLSQLWSAFKRPFTQHIKQAFIYAVIRQIEKVTFIYECKWNQNVKEFTLVVDPDLVEYELEAAADIAYAVRKQRPVDRPMWATTPDHKRCGKCPHRARCWSLDAEEDHQAPAPAARAAKSKKRIIKLASE